MTKPDQPHISPSGQLAREKLKALRKHAGWTVRGFAEAMGYGHKQSSYRTYEDSYKKAHLPVALVEKALPLLVGRGTPPIEARDVWALTGIIPGEAMAERPTPSMTGPATQPAINRAMHITPAGQPADGMIAVTEYDVSARQHDGPSLRAETPPDLSNITGDTTAHHTMLASWSMPRSFLEYYLPDPSGLAMMRVIGNSMEPDFLPSERVLVDTQHRNMSHDGVYVLWNGHSVVIKQLQLIPDATPPRVRIISVNPTYPVDEVALADLHINGRVVGKWQWK